MGIQGQSGNPYRSAPRADNRFGHKQFFCKPLSNKNNLYSREFLNVRIKGQEVEE